MSTTTNPLSSAKELDTLLTGSLGDADTGATQAVGNLTMVQKARASRLARTVEALKRDGADDAEVKAAEAAVQSANARAAVLNVVHLQAATPAPQVAATGWVLHGRVFDADAQPAPGFTVFLVDQAKQFQAQIGYAFTDASGYFLLAYAGSADKQANLSPLAVTVTNENRQTVYLGSAVTEWVAGSITYQDIFLPAGEKPLGEAPTQAPRGGEPSAKKNG